MPGPDDGDMFVLWERNANAISLPMLLLPTNRWKKKISFVVIDVVCLFVFFFSLFVAVFLVACTVASNLSTHN